MSAVTNRLGRSAYGLETASDDALWKQRTACGPTDELWFDLDRRDEAAHVCKRHCPVREQCLADVKRAVAARKPPRDQVVAGLRFTADGKAWEIATKGIRCDRCPSMSEPPLYQPSARKTAPRAVPAAVAQRRDARNLDLLRRLAAGDHVSEMAAELNLSPDTIKSHLRALYIELGARDRTNAVSIAYQRGLLKVQR